MSVNTAKVLNAKGGFRELTLLFLPILGVSFCNCFYLLIEKLFLARLSPHLMEAAVATAFACQLFQLPCISLALMAQVFIGRWRGAEEWTTMGPGLWQFIWFSLFSLLITFPSSYFYGNYYFKMMGVEEIVFPYYHFLISINFLYPLAACLSCFYIGQGKTRLVLLATIISQFMKVLLGYLLIFGWGEWIPSYGLIGGAISTFAAQLGFCAVLLGVFLNKKHVKIYNSRSWYFKPKLFWTCIQPGLLRAIARVSAVACWAAIAHLMGTKGGDYLLVLSIGGSLFLFLPFLGDSICQSETTVVSHILGAHNYPFLQRAFRSGMLLALLTILLVSPFFLIFPSTTFYWLFPTIEIDTTMIQNIFFGVWLSFIGFTLSYIPISYILAFKDTKFSVFMGGINWIIGYLFMYVVIEYFNMPADQFWIAVTFMHMANFLGFYFRMKFLISRASTATALQPNL